MILNKQIFFLLLSYMISILSIFFIQIILARQLTPSNLGAINTALAIIVILSPIASGFGTTQYWIKLSGINFLKFKNYESKNYDYIISLSISSIFLLFLLSFLLE